MMRSYEYAQKEKQAKTAEVIYMWLLRLDPMRILKDIIMT